MAVRPDRPTHMVFNTDFEKEQTIYWYILMKIIILIGNEQHYKQRRLPHSFFSPVLTFKF